MVQKHLDLQNVAILMQSEFIDSFLWDELEVLLTLCIINIEIEKAWDLVFVFRVLRLEERKFDCEHKEDFVEFSSSEEGWKISMLILKNSGIKSYIHTCQF
jgi:hypothetical protein